MTMGTVKLIKYNKAFTYTSVGIALMAGMTALILFTDVNKLLYDNLLVSREIFSDNAKMIVQYVEQGVSFVFNALLLWGIYSIAKETEVKKICNGAIRNFIFSCAHIGAFLLSFVPTKGIQSVKWEFSIIIWILYFANILLNLVLLFSCYANICDADDVEMERKPSKMPILNRIYDENERRMKKARESDALYRMDLIMQKRS